MTVATDQVRWIHGAPDCAANTDPLLQVHRHSRDTFILRESKCFNYEGNFMYLLFGASRAILFDTGAGSNSGMTLPLRKQVSAFTELGQAPALRDLSPPSTFLPLSVLQKVDTITPAGPFCMSLLLSRHASRKCETPIAW